jgi:hypothetical protein
MQILLSCARSLLCFQPGRQNWCQPWGDCWPRVKQTQESAKSCAKNLQCFRRRGWRWKSQSRREVFGDRLLNKSQSTFQDPPPSRSRIIETGIGPRPSLIQETAGISSEHFAVFPEAPASHPGLDSLPNWTAPRFQTQLAKALSRIFRAGQKDRAPKSCVLCCCSGGRPTVNPIQLGRFPRFCSWAKTRLELVATAACRARARKVRLAL